nr:transpeptidase family protein [Saprospiraceae bacterium]
MDSRKILLLRVYLVALGFVIFAFCIAFQLIKVSFIEGAEWRTKSDRLYLKTVEAEGDRGDILSANGLPLATSVQLFDIRMDLNTQAMTDELFFAHVDSLGWYLSQNIDRSKSPVQYRNFLIQRRKAGERYLLLKRNATFEEMNMVRNFPILRWGQNRGGLILERKSRRIKPFRSLAARTIGLDRENAANVGIEGAFDEYLKGETGIRMVQRISGSNWKPVDDISSLAPLRGADVITTLNTDIQDVVHHVLKDALVRHEAQFGVAVVMKTETGEIVAMSNLDRQVGGYIENYNHAVGSLIEPGSLFKIPSLMALLEDGLVDLDQKINLNKGTTTICNRTVRDSEAHDFEETTVRHSLEISSNVGISQLVNEQYKKAGREADFIMRMRNFGLDKQVEIEIAGEATPYIKDAGNRAEGWSCLSLPWMSFGYELSLTPLQMLTFYNAIANNGKMMKPFLVKELRREGQVLKTYKPEVINRAVAGEHTIQQVREVLEGVVENGTGRRIYDSALPMAGKTGTTQLNYTDHERVRTAYQSSFVGYFPADNPEYTCIILISEPTKGGFYGGTVAAPVFSEIAKKIMAIQPDRMPIAFEKSTLGTGNFSYPFWQVGYASDFRYIFSSLGVVAAEDEDIEFTVLMPDEEMGMRMRNRHISREVMPNVVGMGLRDALYVLESAGVNVKINGYGRVVGQSVSPGSSLSNKNIELILDI